MDTNDQNVMSIKQIVHETGLCENYVRKCLKTGSLKTTKGHVPGTNIPKNFITREDFNTWRSNITHSKRDDGRNKYVLYMNEEEHEKLMELLKDVDFKDLVERANKKQVEDN